MSRLLFAAARGARMQRSAASDWEYRIHPDDAHLQYGPISTALRNGNGDGDYQRIAVRVDDMPTLAIEAAIVTGYAGTLRQQWRTNKDPLTRSLFLLILAETLADEGL